MFVSACVGGTGGNGGLGMPHSGSSAKTEPDDVRSALPLERRAIG